MLQHDPEVHAISHNFSYFPAGFESEAELSAVIAQVPSLGLTSWIWTGGQYDTDSNNYKWIGSDTTVDSTMFGTMNTIDSDYKVFLRPDPGELGALSNGISFAALCEDYS